MNLGRGALYAFLLGILWLVAPGLIGNVYSSVLSFTRDTFSIGSTYYAVQNFLNFATGGLMNLIAFEAFTVAAILLGLRGRKSRVMSNFPTGEPSSRVQG